jgi:pimeloyl-ACP methyl ester carboxylesterase
MSMGNRLGLVLFSVAPWLVRAAIRSAATAFEKDPPKFVMRIASQMCAADQALMRRPALQWALRQDLQEAYRQGGDAQFVDGRLVMLSRSWGFDRSDVRVPIFAWHGTDDTVVPVSAAKSLAAAMPALQLTVVPGAGHLLTEHEAVVAALADHVDSEAGGSTPRG